MASDAALLTAKFEDGRLELAAAGSWTAPSAGELEGLVDRAADRGAAGRRLSPSTCAECASSTPTAPGCSSG